jgi:hypothetical protein
MIRRLLLVLAALSGVAAGLPAVAAETVQLRANEHAEGYARIAVEWPAPVAFEAKVDGETLTIHFARTFTAQLSPLAGKLGDYVSSIGQSADGTSIVARLKRPVELKTATVNGRIATIDLVARSPAPVDEHPAKPEVKLEAKPSTDKAPPAKTEAAEATPQKAGPDEADASKAPDETLRAVGQPVNLLTQAATSSAKPTTPAPSAPTPAARAPESVEVRGAEHPDGFARIAVEWPSPVTFETKLDGETLTIHFPRAFKARLAPLAKELGHYVARASQSPDGMSIIARLKRPVEIKTSTVNEKIAAIDLVARKTAATVKPAPKREDAKALKPEPPRAEAHEAKDAKKKDEAPKPEPKIAEIPKAPLAVVPPAMPPMPAPSAPAPNSTGDAETVVSLRPSVVANSERSASLRFDWPMPVGAAVYRRGGAIWIVFAAPTALELDGVRAAKQSAIEAIDQIKAEGATAVRLVTADGVNPSVRRAGNSWIVDLKRQDAATDAPIVVDPRPMPPSPLVELHVQGAGIQLHLRDPMVGDRLTIVPVGDLGRGIDATRDFVDFRLLPSVQGIVIRPNSDDLEVQVKDDAVDVTRPHGLVLSDEHDRLLARSGPNRHRVFDFAEWLGPRNQTYFDRRSALDRAIAAAAPGARTRPRLDLAHFYFAHLFGPETLSVLAQISRDDPKAAAEASFHALKGAACLLSDIDECTSKELGQDNFDKEPEISLWRGAYAARKGDWPAAARDFLDGVGFLNTYPKALRDRFALQAAETMIEGDRASAATPLLDLVSADGPDERDQAMALYLRGRVDQQLGQLQPALDLWTKVAAMTDRKARARALYAKAMALYEAKQASRVETIKALDALRFSWRGDIFEFTLLRRLGELKLQENDSEGGLDALHLAAAYFPDYPATKDVTKEAADAFADLFIGKSSDDMPPVKALALYDEFHDLIPSGERHDAIVKKLVDRLVSVDLLERAAGLLEDQAKHHLSGIDKARAATQLALLRLMNHQPEAAIAALDIELGSGIPPDLARQRQELRARALLDMSRAPEALAMLANDNSRDAYRLRADIYWRQHDWKNAVKVFALLAGEPPAKGPLDAETARLVLSWAAVLTLEGEQKALAKLRSEFGAAMTGTAAAAAFNVIADDNNAAAAAGGTPNQIADRVAQIGALQNFMAAYKQRLANDKLSAIN